MSALDPDDLSEALYNAACTGKTEMGNAGTPTAASIGKVRAGVRRFLEDLPGDATISELREALD